MLNRKEFRQKGHDRSKIMTCHKRGKKYNCGKGGINLVFRSQ
jgi:hypothetical protein